MNTNDPYKAGYTHARWGFTYINPYWTDEDLAEYVKGYQAGTKDMETEVVDD